MLVALSGGGDSVALLVLLREAAICGRLEAAHVHHGARGAEADADADFARELCRRLAIPFYLLRLESPLHRGDGLEAGWRRLRYEALLALREERGLDFLATGHQRDDVAEGVLLQLLRGAGPRAMAGIQPLTADNVVRPLLSWTREELRSWLQARDIPWREDSTNADTERLRARVRHDLLLRLEEASPRLRDHLCRLAAALARDEAAAAEELAALELWIDPWHPDGGVEVSTIAALPPALQVRWLHAQARRSGLGRVSHAQLEGALSLLATGTPRAVSLGRRWSLRRCRHRLWLEPENPPGSYEIHIPTGDEAVIMALPIPGWRAVLRPGTRAASGVEWWRPVRPSPEGFVVRSPRPGERSPDGHQRVVDLLALRIPRHLRRAWPLCCEGDRITWIPGVWQDVASGKPPTHVLEVTRT